MCVICISFLFASTSHIRYESCNLYETISKVHILVDLHTSTLHYMHHTYIIKNLHICFKAQLRVDVQNLISLVHVLNNQNALQSRIQVWPTYLRTMRWFFKVIVSTIIVFENGLLLHGCDSLLVPCRFVL